MRTWYAWGSGTSKTAAYYHATPHDLSGQTHLLPPAETGVQPHWEDMDPSEAHQVFMSPTVDSAHGWGSELGQDYRIYEVEPEGEVEDHVHTQAAPRARIVRQVWPGSKTAGLDPESPFDLSKVDWWHGSHQMAPFDRFDFDRNRPYTDRESNPKHWNSHLGSHFTSEHETAARLAFDHSGSVYHCNIAMQNPKHYFSEHDLDREAYEWAQEKGYHSGGYNDPEVALRRHPKVKEIAEGFKDHLRLQGHDAITYGNEYEGSHLHECAIAFHPSHITIKSVHHSAEECDDGIVCQHCQYPHVQDKEEGSQCDNCGEVAIGESDEDWMRHHHTALLRHFAEQHPSGVWEPDYESPETKHKNALNDHLTEHHPHLLYLPEKIRDLHHRLEHTESWKGGPGEVGQPSLLAPDHDHDDLTDPAKPKAWRLKAAEGAKTYWTCSRCQQRTQTKRLPTSWRQLPSGEVLCSPCYREVNPSKQAAKEDDDLEFRDTLEQFLDLLAKDPSNSPGTNKMLNDPETRGRFMNHLDETTPRYAPGTFDRHVEDQLKSEGAKEAHSYYRGIYLGGDTKSVYISPEEGSPVGIGHSEDRPADYSDQGILDALAKHQDWKRSRGLIVGPEHPAHDRLPMYGSHWTEDERLAKKFAFDASHGRYRVPRNPTRPTTGVVLEMQSSVPPERDRLGSQFGETEVKWPGRSKVDRMLVHVHRYDPEVHGPAIIRADTHVRTFEVPREHLEKHAVHQGIEDHEWDYLSRVLEATEQLPDAKACYQASTAIHHGLGWPQESGYYVGGGRREGHYWNRKPDGTIVDATHDQFDDETDPVRVVPPGHPGQADYQPSGRTATKDEGTESILDLLGGPQKEWRPPQWTERDEAERLERKRKHEDWQSKRPGVNPGDDLSQGMEGYPDARWVPLRAVEHFAEHTGDQGPHSEQTIHEIHQQLESGRGLTDPVMLLVHNEQGRASLGEGNHRLQAAKRAGWTHIPARVCRMYDGEAERGKGRPIPFIWRGGHQGRTPEMCSPDQVFHVPAMEHVPSVPPKEGTLHAMPAMPSHASPYRALPSHASPDRAEDKTTQASRTYSGGEEVRREEDRREGHSGRGSRVGHAGDGQRGLGALFGWVRAAVSRGSDGGPRPVTWHPKAVKDLKALDRPVQKQIKDTIDKLANDDPTVLAQTHPMKKINALGGWSSTKASRGHRIIHQRTDDGGIYIGYVGLHEYDKAIQRLTSAEYQFVEEPQEFKEHEDADERRMRLLKGDIEVAKTSYLVHPEGVMVYTMSTHPDHRRRGHMTRLIEEVGRRHGRVTFDETRTPSGQAFIDKRSTHRSER